MSRVEGVGLGVQGGGGFVRLSAGSKGVETNGNDQTSLGSRV